MAYIVTVFPLMCLASILQMPILYSTSHKFICWSISIAKTRRDAFMKGMGLHYGSRAEIAHDDEYVAIMKLYQLNETLSKYPFRMRFVHKGIDLGGVCRDAFACIKFLMDQHW